MLTSIPSQWGCLLTTYSPHKSVKYLTQTSFRGTSESRSTSRSQSWASLSPSYASSNSMKTSLFFTRLKASISSAGVLSLMTPMMTNPLKPSTPMTFPQSAKPMRGLFGCVLSRCVQRHWHAIQTLSRKTTRSCRGTTCRLTKAIALCSAPVRRKFFTSWWTWEITCSIC